MIRPAVMYLAGQSYGLVRLPNGQILSQFGEGSNMPFLATWNCTGFVVNPDGWVATAGHCVDPESAKTADTQTGRRRIHRPVPGLARSPGPGRDTGRGFRRTHGLKGTLPTGVPRSASRCCTAPAHRSSAKMPANVVDFRPLGKGRRRASQDGKAQPAVVRAGYRRRRQHRYIDSLGGFRREHRTRSPVLRWTRRIRAARSARSRRWESARSMRSMPRSPKA